MMTYLKLRTNLRGILSNIEFIDMCDGWSDYFHCTKGTLPYYDRILKCECYDASVINSYQYGKATELLGSLFFLMDEDYMLYVSLNDNDEKLSKSLCQTEDMISDLNELLAISFQGFYDFGPLKHLQACEN
jgi:hypothetical protein